MKHVIAHDLSREDARKLLDEAQTEYARRFAKYQPRLQWLAPDQARVSFHAMGRELGGTARLLERGLELDFEVPFMLRPFLGRAKDAVEREVGRLVAAFQARRQPPQ